jgi:hypothetical protein
MVDKEKRKKSEEHSDPSAVLIILSLHVQEKAAQPIKNHSSRDGQMMDGRTQERPPVPGHVLLAHYALAK